VFFLPILRGKSVVFRRQNDKLWDKNFNTSTQFILIFNASLESLLSNL
jgi:hypothetical protein